MYSNRYNDKIEQLENEIKEKQEEIENTTNQSTIDRLEEEVLAEDFRKHGLSTAHKEVA